MDNRGEAIGAGGLIIAAIVAAWASLRGKEHSSPAETQEEINHGFSKFMAASNEERDDLRQRIAKLEGDIRNLKQYNRSLVKILLKNKIDVPVYEYTNGAVIGLQPPEA